MWLWFCLWPGLGFGFLLLVVSVSGALKEGDCGACVQLLFMLLLVNTVVYVTGDVFSFCFDRWSVPFLYEKRKGLVVFGFPTTTAFTCVNCVVSFL